MATKKYVCDICGYTHEGDKAPDVCPLCKATADKFSEVAVAGAPAPKKRGINTNSDLYAVFYAAVVVIIVAFLLAAVSSSLGERQQQNIRLDKMKQILSSLNIKNVGDAQAEYNKVVKSDAIINANGESVKDNGGFDVKNDDITPDNLPLYICEVDGETKYVIPMLGQGLWGGIWGYMAVNSDGNTIYGTYFSHSSETPGLGAEIASEKFTSLFEGKQLLDGGNVALVVKKGANASSASEVNAISGATITCTGLDAMLKKYLENYKAFLAAKQQPVEADVEPAPATEATDAAVTEANVTE